MSQAGSDIGARHSTTTARREAMDLIKTVLCALVLALAVRTLLVQPYVIPSASEEPNLYRGDYILVTKWSYGYSRHSILGSPELFRGRILFRAPRRGDIVVFKLPRDGHTDYIKRLVGLPGDRIAVRRGRLTINGRALDRETVGAVNAIESRGEYADPGAIPATLVRETAPEGRRYLTQALSDGGEANDTGVYIVPPHCYFMMGDNRDNSADSRFDSGLPAGDSRLGGCGWDGRLDAEVGPQLGVGFVPEENLVGRARLILLSWNTGIDEWHNDGAVLLRPWTWLTQLRPSRFLTVLQ